MKTISILAAVVFGASLAFAQASHTSRPVKKVLAIGGTVIDLEAKPVCNVRVCAIAEDFDETKPNVFIPCAMSDTRGHFLIAQSRTGKFKIHYDGVAQGYWPSRFPFFRHPTIVAPEVVVDKVRPRDPINLMLAPRNGMVVGRTVDAKTGLPIDSVEFTLCHASDPRICRVSVVKSSDGKYTLPTPHVPFTLRARAEGFDDWLGLRGDDQTELSVGSGASFQLDVVLTRQRDAENLAINEAEKLAGLNLPAPDPLSPNDGSIFVHYPRKTRLEWSPVDGAVSYSLEVDYCQPDRQQNTCVKAHPLELPGNPSMKGVIGTTYEFYFVGAQPGRWRVWAVDKEGIEGFKSSWRKFVYRR